MRSNYHYSLHSALKKNVVQLRNVQEKKQKIIKNNNKKKNLFVISCLTEVIFHWILFLILFLYLLFSTIKRHLPLSMFQIADYQAVAPSIESGENSHFFSFEFSPRVLIRLTIRQILNNWQILWREKYKREILSEKLKILQIYTVFFNQHILYIQRLGKVWRGKWSNGCQLFIITKFFGSPMIRLSHHLIEI